MPQTDSQLLERFARTQDEQAFEMLVARHLGMVLGAARRRLPGRNDLAEEVAQNVFVTLARKVGSLRKHPCIPAWLQKTAAFEAMRAARREGNHVKKLNRLQDELETGSDPGGDPRLLDALPVLDDAMASLGDGDRRALMWRFYEEKSFKVIAALTGKSEAACQKQARRAVDKLGALLRRRGVAIPATVLASGLAAELGKAAPGELAASVAKASTSQLAATAASTSLISQLTIMKTKTAVAAGAAILIACAGTGWVAGKATRPATNLSAEGIPDDRTSSNRNLSDEPKVSAHQSKEETRETLRKLLELARGELAEEKYDIAAGARARARLARIPADAIPLALEMIGAMDGGYDVEHALTDALLTCWAKIDGLAACDFSLEHRTPQTMGLPPIRPVLTAWAEVDPQKALNWYLEQSEAKHPGLNEKAHGRWKAIANIRWVMSAWIHSDIDGAIAAFRKLEDEGHRGGAITAFGENAGPVQGREKLLDLYLELPKNLRQPTLGRALDNWSRHRPEELAEWVDENPVEGVHHTYLPPRVLRNWLLSDSEAAIEWWMTRPFKYERDSRIRQLVRHWTNTAALGDWLAAQDRDGDFDGAVMDYAEKIAPSDPQGAFGWAMSIGAKPERDRALGIVVGSWAGTDLDAAREAIDNAELPEKVKTGLTDIIEPQEEGQE